MVKTLDQIEQEAADRARFKGFDVRPGEILVHIDSSGFIEIAVNEGSAKSLIKAREGELIEIVPNKME